MNKMIKAVFVPYAGKLFSMQLKWNYIMVIRLICVFVPYAGKLFSIYHTVHNNAFATKERFRPLCGEAVFNMRDLMYIAGFMITSFRPLCGEAVFNGISIYTARTAL